MSRPIRVAIESYYRTGDVAANIAFAEAICRFAVSLGYAPFAMHLHYTRFLNDNIPDERALGIQCGLTWTDLADEVWFCLRPGETLTEGMRMALERDRELRRMGIERKVRHLVFRQDGQLLSGWEGELPRPSRLLLAQGATPPSPAHRTPSVRDAHAPRPRGRATVFSGSA